ncbi:MAG: hypothetical protein ACPGU3_08060 [Litorivicinus sp.]
MNESLIAALAKHLALPTEVSIYDINFAFGAVSLVIKHLGADVCEQTALSELLNTTQDIALWALNNDSSEAAAGLRDGVFFAADLLENEQLPLAA